MTHIETDRLILRQFTEEDAGALFSLLSDKEVNRFLPMFPLRDIKEAEAYLRNRYITNSPGQRGFDYALCLKEDNVPIGYVHVSGDDNHDLGYGLRKELWRKGLCSEACRAVIGRARQAGIPYITATHDVNNPHSGQVMQAIGMKYRYSYKELWQPKNFMVTFRMYQLNLDGCEDRIYRKYWDRYPHFIESEP